MTITEKAFDAWYAIWTPEHWGEFKKGWVLARGEETFYYWLGGGVRSVLHLAVGCVLFSFMCARMP